jgi:hypothetical protein
MSGSRFEPGFHWFKPDFGNISWAARHTHWCQLGGVACACSRGTKYTQKVVAGCRQGGAQITQVAGWGRACMMAVSAVSTAGSSRQGRQWQAEQAWRAGWVVAGSGQWQAAVGSRWRVAAKR